MMSEGKIITGQGMCVVSLTKHLMRKYNLSHEAAYAKLLHMELYKLLIDQDTRLFLETNEYLKKCCDIETEDGIDMLYSFINSNSD